MTVWFGLHSGRLLCDCRVMHSLCLEGCAKSVQDFMTGPPALHARRWGPVAQKLPLETG